MTLLYFLMLSCLLFMAAKASSRKEKVMFYSLLFVSMAITAMIIVEIVVES